MNRNPLTRCTLIIHCEAEYSTAMQTVILRCMLESSGTGRRHGFTDLTALLTAIQRELTAMQSHILPLEEEKA